MLKESGRVLLVGVDDGNGTRFFFYLRDALYLSLAISAILAIQAQRGPRCARDFSSALLGAGSAASTSLRAQPRAARPRLTPASLSLRSGSLTPGKRQILRFAQDFGPRLRF